MQVLYSLLEKMRVTESELTMIDKQIRSIFVSARITNITVLNRITVSLLFQFGFHFREN